MNVRAIPTHYNGTQFRSRLEARWAAMFDLLGWKWAYEPLDLSGYIPDFVVKVPHATGKTFDKLVEVKPALKFTDYEEAQGKIERSGWAGAASCVGAVVEIMGDDVCLGCEWIDGEFWTPWLSDRSDAIDLWREAGNLVQWRSPIRRPAPKSMNTNELQHLVPKDVVAEFYRTFSIEDIE